METGDFAGNIDDIFIFTTNMQIQSRELNITPVSSFNIYPNSVTSKRLNIDFYKAIPENELLLILSECAGRILLNRLIMIFNHPEMPEGNIKMDFICCRWLEKKLSGQKLFKTLIII